MLVLSFQIDDQFLRARVLLHFVGFPVMLTRVQNILKFNKYLIASVKKKKI